MEKQEIYLILPGCDDTNRGDQALIWETMRIANDAGYKGKYYMIATEECSLQSKKIGIDRLDYVLPHPSEKVKDNNNFSYGLGLKFKWALASFQDVISSILLLNRLTRKLITPFLQNKKRKTLDIFKNAEAAFVKGGGFLHAYGNAVDAYKIYFFIYHMLLARSLNIPVYILPNSFGPFNDGISRWLIKSLMKKCNFVSARESVSAEYMKKMYEKEIVCTNDLAVYLEPDYNIDLEHKFKEHGIPFDNNKLVAITVRPYRFPGQNNPKESYMKYQHSIANFIEWLSDKGFIPVLVEHVYSENIHERDMSCIEDVKKIVSRKARCYIFSDLSMNSKQMKAFYGHFRFIVGTRFHSVIFSMLESVPAIAITYGGNKGTGIMKDLGLEKYTVEIEDISADKLKKMFINLINEEVLLKEKLEKYKIQCEEDRKDLIKRIKKKDAKI